MSGIKNKVGAPMGNTNAEKWTEEEATKFLLKALDLSMQPQYDFIGEVAKAMGSYIDQFEYVSEKFPQLQHLKTQIKRNCEVNCFTNSKKGVIKEATAIVNLKSNHGWTDRQQMNVTGGVVLHFDKDDEQA